jgi:hypothetical protein
MKFVQDEISPCKLAAISRQPLNHIYRLVAEGAFTTARPHGKQVRIRTDDPKVVELLRFVTPEIPK